VRLVLAALAAMLLVSLLPYALAQPNFDEAAAIFQEAGCTQCHNGGMAPDFQGTVEVIASWAQYYDTIDEAVRNEYRAFGGANSYDEMMQQMRQYTPGITDEQFQYLYQFFLEVFEYYKAQASQPTTTTTTPPPETTTTTTTEQPPETQTPCETTTVTVTETVEKTVEKTVTVLEQVEVTPPECRAKPDTAKFAPVVAAVLVLAALGYAVYNLKGA